jgi:DNA-directed RNA polymerase subunit RPC12/RpoP
MSKPKKSEIAYYLVSRCPSCGAAKSRPSATAYVYCDFCGSLADYDFRKACEQARELPGPVYEKLANALKSECEKAILANNREKYLQTQLKLFDAWVDACPNAVPVRVKDADFRKHYISHMAECATACAFDPVSKKIADDMTQAIAKLQWMQAGAQMRASRQSFMRLLEAVVANMERCYSDDMQQQYTPHPDGATAAVLKRVANALFVQGWLPYVDEATAKILLERTGLAQEYLTAQSHPSMQLSCGHCKNTVPVFPGAKQCVCEQCGHKLTVEQGINCDGCGSHLAIDQNAKEFSCPHCQRKIERLGSQWQGAFIISSQA